jgi:NhaP-type Na+/H+ or K+/H+ antiporter
VTSTLSADDILLGLGLVVVLAVGSQLLARRLGLPAIVVLLPAGFIAGVATDAVHPEDLLGSLYQPFVSLAVGVILFEAGMRLSGSEVERRVRRALTRLITVGVVITCAAVAGGCLLLFGDMNRGVAFLVGAILVVSGPTVVLPLLAFIRPTGRMRALLKFEGVLVDPLGALLGVIVFEAVSAEAVGRSGWRPGEMLTSLGVGLLVGVVAAALLWLIVADAHRDAPRMVAPATLMVVVAAVVAADLIHADSGLAAATLMGVALGNQDRIRAAWRIDLSHTMAFWETIVQLLVGVLFILVSASVSPGDVRDVLPEALGLVGLMVLVIRPVVAAWAMWRSSFSWRERAFVGWMAPRGIVAGATAAAFGPALVQQGVAGAEKVLPIVFVAIFATVVLYGLTAPIVARLLGLAETGRGVVLVISGHRLARELGAALAGAGVSVRLWAGDAEDREAARALGLEADPGRMMVDRVSREAELEGVTDALLLSRNDDFNAVAAAELRTELGHGHVYRVAPESDRPDLLPPATETGILGTPELTLAELDRRLADGWRIVERTVGPRVSADGAPAETPLFAVGPTGRLSVAASGRPPETRPGDTLIALEDAAPRGAPARA